MGMNIRNEETEPLVRELAALTGESETAAVTTAVRERLERLRVVAPGRQGSALAERLLAIGRDAATRMTEPYKSADHGALLYDDMGMPKSSAE